MIISTKYYLDGQLEMSESSRFKISYACRFLTWMSVPCFIYSSIFNQKAIKYFTTMLIIV